MAQHNADVCRKILTAGDSTCSFNCYSYKCPCSVILSDSEGIQGNSILHSRVSISTLQLAHDDLRVMVHIFPLYLLHLKSVLHCAVSHFSSFFWFKGEIFELKAELNSDKKEKKKEAVKKVIASMTVGKDVRWA